MAKCMESLVSSLYSLVSSLYSLVLYLVCKAQYKLYSYQVQYHVNVKCHMSQSHVT